ncbi:unnamed protein product, partial [Mesorhabditis belari]|uniref:Transmembrane protein 129 n=1 Tax=Mesorhabditis belari TaxID=2138241 RepID=A0AAF3EEG4_9BILA
MRDDYEIFIWSTITFGMTASLVIWPNDVLISNHLTIEELFHSYLGDQSKDPLEYNCRKIVLNQTILGCLPFVYSLITFFYSDLPTVSSRIPSTKLHYFTNISILILIGSLTYFFFHHNTKFTHLKPMKYLKLYSEDLTRIRAQLSTEFRNFFNFSVSLAYSSRIIISDSWVMNFNRYNFIIVNISDIQFEAVNAQQFALNETGEEVQYVSIRANILNRSIPHFFFRIKGTDFRDLQDKLTSRIEIAREIIFHVSPNERFVEVFQENVNENGTYPYPDTNSLESCIGCYATQANVKINQGCQQQGRQQCRQCFCRPMWCVSCLGRVFAGKQDQSHPEFWLNGQADCPTCRAIFCVRDVQMLRVNDEDNH